MRVREALENERHRVSRRRSTATWLRPLAALLVFSLAATACGDDDAETELGNEGTVETPANLDGEGAPAEELQDVRVLLATSALPFAPVVLARGLDLFKEHGLNVQWQPEVPDTARSSLSVVTGDADIAVSVVAGAIGARDADRPIKVVGTTTVGNPLDVTLTNEVVERLAAEGVTPSSPVEERFQALKGLRIGTGSPGGSREIPFRAALIDAGLDPDSDLQLQSFGSSDAPVPALRAGQIDGNVSPVPWSVQPVLEGFGTVWISGSEVPAWAETGVYTAVMASESYIEENAEVVEKFLAALDDALAVMRDDPALAVDVVTEELEGMSPELVEVSLEAVGPYLPSSSAVTRDLLAESIENFNAQASDPTTVTAEDLLAETVSG